jgi:hypothetical protein
MMTSETSHISKDNMAQESSRRVDHLHSSEIQNEELLHQQSKNNQSFRPILGSTSRFFGLVIFAICWVGLLLKGSKELFGTKATMHELTVGSGSMVDFGFSGDYMGWGEASSKDSGFPEFEFGEIVELIHDLVCYHHLVRR